jgi:hypothetical protein
MIQHEFIAIDEGHATLLHINECDQSKNWIVPISRPQSRDMQLIGGNRILIGHHHGYTEFDITLGRVAKEFAALEGVTAARRQANGHTIIAGVNIAGVTGVVVLELDANDQEVHRAIFPGDYVRLIRQTARETYPCRATTGFAKARATGNISVSFRSKVFITLGKGCVCHREICSSRLDTMRFWSNLIRTEKSSASSAARNKCQRK